MSTGQFVPNIVHSAEPSIMWSTHGRIESIVQWLSAMPEPRDLRRHVLHLGQGADLRLPLPEVLVVPLDREPRVAEDHGRSGSPPRRHGR